MKENLDNLLKAEIIHRSFRHFGSRYFVILIRKGDYRA